MAAGRKEYELSLKLSAALGSNFNSAFQSAMNTARKMQSTLESVKKVQGDISAYQKTQEAINATKAKVQDYTKKHDSLQNELAQTLTKEKELQAAVAKAKENQAAAKDVETYKKLEAEHDKLQKELEQTTGKKNSLERQIKANETATANATQKIEQEENKLSALSQTLGAAGVNTKKLAQETDKLKSAYDRVRKSQEEYARVNAAIEKNKEAISATKSELTKTVGVLAAAGTGFYKGFIEPAAEFEEQMSTVKAISNASGADMAKLTALAKEMGATTKFTAVEAGQALEYMAMAGWKTEDMLGGLKGVMDLAAASGEDLASVSDIVTDAMTAFGLSAKGTTNGVANVTYFADILAATSANANTNVGLLGESFKYAAPLAGAFGFSVEDTALMLGLMANSGIKASQSGTSLRKIFTALSGTLEVAQKDGSTLAITTQNADGSMRSLKDIIDDVRKAFNGMSASDIADVQKNLSETAESLGISLNDENGELKTQGELYAEVQDALQGLTEAGKVHEAEMLASKTAMAGLLSIVNSSEEDYNKLADAIANATGSAEKMSQTRLDNLNGDLTLAKSAWDGLATTIGDLFIPNLRVAVQHVTGIIGKIDEFVKANPELIKSLVKVGGGLAALKVGSVAGKLGLLSMKGGFLEVAKTLIGFKANIAESAAEAATGGGTFAKMGKSIANYFKGVKSSFGGVGKSIDSLAGGKISGVFSKIGAGIQSKLLKPLGGLGSKVSSALGNVGGKISGVFGNIGKKIASGPLGKLGGVLKSVGSAAGAALGGPLKGLTSLFGGLFGKVMPIIAIISALSILLVKLSGGDISGFLAPLKDAFEALKPVLKTALEQLKQLGSEMLPLILNAAKTLAPLLGQIITAILPVVLQLIQSIVPLIAELVRSLLPVILNIITTLAPLLTNIITSVLPIFAQLLETLLPIITQIAQSVLPIIADVLNMLLPMISDLVNAVLPVLMQILQALMPVVRALATLFSNVLGAAIEGLKPVINALMGILQGIIDFVVGVFSGDWGKAWEGVKNIFKNIIDGIVAVFKFPINLIIEGINTFLSGLNKLKIPDWVPGVGGKGINIPLIPKLEKGSEYTPDNFIAGDVNGKGGEIVANARGRKVFTAAETSEILKNINVAKAIAKSGSAEVNAEKTADSERKNRAAIFDKLGEVITAVKAAILPPKSDRTTSPTNYAGNVLNAVKSVVAPAKAVTTPSTSNDKVPTSMLGKLDGIVTAIKAAITTAKAANPAPTTNRAGDAASPKKSDTASGKENGGTVKPTTPGNSDDKRPANLFDKLGEVITAVKTAILTPKSDGTASPTNYAGNVLNAVKSVVASYKAIPAPITITPLPKSPSVPQYGEVHFDINYSPTIYTNGEPGDLEEKLKKNNDALIERFKEFLRQEREKERRTSYA